MQRSTDRVLTTHTGSLPRPDDLVEMMFRKAEGEPVDQAGLEARADGAVREIVERQRAAGIDVVSDGEMSKPSYATYVKDRLSGFGGESHPLTYQDVADFPELNRRFFTDPGRSRRKTPGCNGPISVRDHDAVNRDVQRLRAALEVAPGTDALLTAASPGVASLFF